MRAEEILQAANVLDVEGNDAFAYEPPGPAGSNTEYACCIPPPKMA